MDRRSFVCTVTCLALGPAVRSSAQGADATPGSQPKLKIGFLGAAYSHAPPKLALLRNHADFELVGVWDDDPKVRDQVAGQGIPVLSQDDVLSQSDVIAVESVVRDHARYARIALEAGKHVHLEKPPSLEFDDFQEIVQMARQKGLVLQGGYQYRHSPAFNAVIEAAREGWLGDVYMVRATMNNQLAVERRAEWAQYKGGVMYELGSHMVDAVVRLLGKPEQGHSLSVHARAVWRLAQGQHAGRAGVSAGHRHDLERDISAVLRRLPRARGAGNQRHGHAPADRAPDARAGPRTGGGSLSGRQET